MLQVIAPHPSPSDHHYLILREYFIPFSPSDVANASQPCQIQVTTFIFTIVSMGRQKNHIYLQRLCWSLPGWNRKKKNKTSGQSVCCPVLRLQNHGQILLHRKQQQGLPSAPKMWPRRQFEAHQHVRHAPSSCSGSWARGSELTRRLDKTPSSHEDGRLG